MKKSIKKSPKKSLIVSSLAVAVQGLLLASLSTVAHANTTTVKKPIGDLEIYQTAQGGKITITMMLDTSGSMTDTGFSDGSACELSPIDNMMPGYQLITEKSTTTPSYDRYICRTDGRLRRYEGYVYFPVYTYTDPRTRRTVTSEAYLACKDALCRSLDSRLTVGSKPPNYNTTSKEPTEITFSGGVKRAAEKLYVAREPTEAQKKLMPAKGDHPDRITRLKDAMFELMSGSAIQSDVSIGIGQFSTNSNSSNTPIGADNRTGKILVPAAPLDAAQRARIKEAVANVTTGGGTPAAAAYAEVGAYMLGTTTVGAGTHSENGATVTIPSGFPNSITSSKNGNKYISPLPAQPTTCDGHGIYFLTDGEPNNSLSPDKSMRVAFGKAYPTTGETLQNGSQGGNGMQAVGYFSKALRDANINPKGLSVRTAVVGFGSVFDTRKYPGISKPRKKPKLDPKTSLPTSELTAKDGIYFDCRMIEGSVDARNACMWGAKSHPELPGVGGYGEGGFFSAQDSDDVVQSVKDFLGDLENELSSTPSGTIHIPDDPYSVAGQQAIAYMPMIEPKVATKDMVWPGNMKKYHLRNGTIWGKNNQRLYTNVKGDLNANAQDGWSTSVADNNKVTVGGFYAHLKNPKGNVENVRQLFIEDFSGTGSTEADKKPKARKFGVNAQGKITLDDSASNTFHDTTTYTLATVKYLLHFLGFTDATVNGTSYSIDRIPDGTALSSITLQAPTDEIRVLGSSPHSTPTALSYSAKLDDSGNVSLAVKDRDDYVVFGSMDGALHLVDARDRDIADDSTTGVATGGSEVFAFIPKVMLANQVKALQKGATHDNDGQPVFGVDAPWAVITDYDYDNDDSPTKMQVDTSGNKGVYAYGGFRLGGEGLYGLKLNNKNNPELKFALTPQTTGFERLGQIWSKPTKAKIKSGDGSRDVLIFGGGYDLCYENENFQVGATNETYTIAQNQRGEVCKDKAEAVGNAVYMVDAHTGARLWTGTSNDMKHSIVASVNTLDRDNDGNLDAIYFADLGGQVFRADFDNSQSSSAVTAKRIVRLLKPAQGGSKYARRFYEKPVISIYRGDAQFNNGQLFALVNVISGDRSNPTSKMRVGKANADRLYGIFDTDIGKRDLYTLENTALFAREIEDANLEDLSGINGQAAKPGKITAVKGKKGWYHPIVDFDGYTNVNYGKGIGKSEVIGSLLFSSVYNPDKEYSVAQACVASIKGGTERQMYCLPYGVCLNERSTNGKGGFSPAGQGISELTLGPLDGTTSGSRKRTLISNVGLNPDSSTGASRTDFGEGATGSSIPTKQTGDNGATKDGGMGSHPDIIADPRFTLQPVRWYDNTVKN